MSPAQNPNMPFTRDELIQLKHNIQPNDYQLVESGQQRILVIRSPQEFPDIVNDLESMINQFDLRDTDQLTHACIIGDAEVVGVSPEAIKSLVARRIEDDERIAEDLTDKLIEPYTTLLFESEDDPFKILRLGIRVKGNLNDFKPQQLSENLFSKIKGIPRTGEVVYLIADDGYIRLSGKEFYKKLREFLTENPKKNKELSNEFIGFARDNLADHFVGLNGKNIQEPINKYISTDQKSSENIDPKDDRSIIESEKNESTKTTETITEIKQEPIKKDKISKRKFDSKGPLTGTEIKPRPMSDSELEPGPDPDQKWPSETSFIIQLQDKLSETGFEIIKGVEVPGVDVIANNPQSIVHRVFFSYMPKFNFKKALDLERSLNRFDPELCVIIGAADDTDLILFSVGKYVAIADIDTIINTDYLIHLEEQI